MTDEPAQGRSRGLIVAAAAVAVAGAVAWLAFSGIGSALVYYRTPTELRNLGVDGIGLHIRLGGLVQPGTLVCADDGVDFVITDGETEIPVQGEPGLLCPREGVGAVVQGRLSTLGAFEATEVIIKHDENYVAPTQGAIPSQAFDPGT